MDTDFLIHPWAAACRAFAHLDPAFAPSLIEVRVRANGLHFRRWTREGAIPRFRGPVTGSKLLEEVGSSAAASSPANSVGDVVRAYSAPTNYCFQSHSIQQIEQIGLIFVLFHPAGTPSEGGLLYTSLAWLAADLMKEVLGSAAAQEVRHLPPGQHYTFGPTETELLRRSCARVLEEQLGSRFSFTRRHHNTFHTLDALSGLGYERRPAVGRLTFCSSEPSELDLPVQFADPVLLSDRRATRRVLEMTSDALAAICFSGQEIAGLGNVDTDAPGRRLVDVYFDGPRRWSAFERRNDRVYRGGVAIAGPWEDRLFVVDHGVPRLPRPQIDRDSFLEQVQAGLPGEPLNEDGLWRIARAALGADHGALVVVCSRAAEEAERLSQATRVTPITEPSDEVLAGLFSVDGALLVTPSGEVHAVGAILDGSAADSRRATLREDPARGSRFNSAVRYVVGRTAAGVATVALVASEDGHATLLSESPPHDVTPPP